MGRECLPRPLSASEKEASERVAEQLRKALPAAPDGWTIRGERTDVAAGSCPAEDSGKAVAQPVTISVLRNFARNDAPPPAAPAAPQPAAQPPSNAEHQARAAALEKQIAELQRKEQAAGAAYREARRAGDSAAQRQATEQSRKYRLEMGPLQRELRELRNVERRARAADGEARTRAAQARMEEARANRRDASVSIQTNLRQSEMRGSRPLSVDGVPLAFRERSGATQLVFGGWRRSGSFALAQIDESVPTTRVQNARVRIDANEPVTEQLLAAMDVKSVGESVDSPAPRQAQLRREAQQPDSATVQIALQVGTKDYRFSGAAECKAAPQASIYGVPAALYSVSQRSGSGSLNLTLWQPKDGAAIMMSLRIAAGGKSYLVDTVKAGPKRDTKGSGRATLQKTGAGGVIAVDAVDASGEKITGKIECNRFGAIRAEGG
jgi:hypothetical protein